MVNGELWVGCKNGNLSVVPGARAKIRKRLRGHDDAVEAMCSDGELVFTGARSKDGRIATWCT